MSKVLLLRGSLLAEDVSVSSRVLKKFTEAYQVAHPADEMELVDVNELNNIRLTTTMMSNQLVDSDYEVIENRNAMLDKFLNADKIVIASPMWNFGLPGVMKEALDCFVVAGKTFKYLDAPNEKGEIVTGLTTGKKLLMIQSMGGLNAGANDIAHKQVDAIFGLMGVKDFTYIAVQANDIPGMSEIEKGISKAQEVAKEF